MPGNQEQSIIPLHYTTLRYTTLTLAIFERKRKVESNCGCSDHVMQIIHWFGGSGMNPATWPFMRLFESRNYGTCPWGGGFAAGVHASGRVQSCCLSLWDCVLYCTTALCTVHCATLTFLLGFDVRNS